MKIISLLYVIFSFISCQTQNLPQELAPETSGAVQSIESKQSQNGAVRLLATDAPFDFQSVSSAQITINEVRLRGENGKNFILLDKTVSIELLDLKNGLLSTLSEIEIPAGRYDQVSLIVVEALVQLKDGRSFPLKVPSGDKSGLKIFLSPSLDVKAGITSDLLLDFDLSRSFVAKGIGKNITGFNFKPVIRGACLSKTGSIFGKVFNSMATLENLADDAPVSGAIITLMKYGEIVATAVSEADGYFKILGLTPGVYTAAAVAPGLSPIEISDIEILAGRDTEQDFLLNPDNNNEDSL